MGNGADVGEGEDAAQLKRSREIREVQLGEGGADGAEEDGTDGELRPVGDQADGSLLRGKGGGRQGGAPGLLLRFGLVRRDQALR